MCGITISPPPANAASKLDLTGGTMTGQLVLQLASATGALNVSPVWNNGATTFVGIYGRVTNTASGANSKLIDLALADGSYGVCFSKDGKLEFTGSSTYRQAYIGVPGAPYGAVALGVNGSTALVVTAGSIQSNGFPVAADWGGYFSLRESGSAATELSIRRGTGSPEGVVTANAGSLYLNSSGGPPYYKNTGTGNTGWILLT